MIIIDPITLGDVASSRSSSASYYDKTGTLQTAVANALRISYSPDDLTKAPYALVEGTSPNYATYSQDFTNAVWSTKQLGVTPNAAGAPDATTTGDKLVPTTTNATHVLSRQYSVVAGQPYTWSRYVKAGEYGALYVSLSDAFQYQRGSGSAIATAMTQSIHSGSVVAAFRYDVSKDSDPSWIARCQYTSWYNETICTGAWRGQLANLTAAWAVVGAAAGDYYQNTTDGKFYTIGGSAAAQTQTEVFRGNSRAFPAVVAIIAESGRVVIYDLTQPGCPMWMVFVASNTGVNWWSSASLVSSLAYANGKLIVGSSGSGLRIVDFVQDTIRLASTSDGAQPASGIAARNGMAAWGGTGRTIIVNGAVNSIAVAVLPGAPTDPATNLPVPTVAVAMAGGVSVIKHDGTVVSVAITNNSVNTVALHYPYVSFDVGGNTSHFLSAYDLTTLTTHTITTVDSGDAQRVWQFKSAGGTGSGYARLLNRTNSPTGPIARAGRQYALGDSNGVSYIKENPSNPAASMVDYITNAYNTGWQVGDIRGCYLADTVAETIAASGELVSNGTFDTDISGWTIGAAALASWDATGKLSITADGSGFGTTAVQSLSTIAGKTYRLAFTFSGTAGTVRVGSVSNGQDLYPITSKSPGTYEVSFVATGPTSWLQFNSTSSTVATLIDNVSCKLVSPDRSVKNKGLVVYGTLVKSAVASGAQLVGFSGFSAANYLEQPYNSDLDFGTGDFCVMGWFNATTLHDGGIVDRTNAATAGGFLMRTASDGTILAYTRNATGTVQQLFSTGKYAAGTATHVAMVRQGTTLSIYLNGALAGSGTVTALDLTGTSTVMRIGVYQNGGAPFNGTLALIRIGATAPSADQIAQIYSDELALFQPNAKCTIDGTSSAITALAYDDSANILQVGTSWGRSAFSGLVRTESSATQVGAVTTLAAGGGAHVTAGTSGARTVQPDLSYYVPNKFDRWALFDLSTGKIVSKDTDSGTTATIDSVGNGYYRVRLSAVAQATGSGGVYTYVAPTAGVLPQSLVYNGDGISGLYAWQEDFIDGLVMQSPIATTNTTVTRAADVIGTGTGLVYSNVAITEPNYSAATTYNLNDIVHDPATHLTYKSLIASNVGNALADTSKWLQLNVTNRWLMFDQYSGTQTSNAEEIIVVVAPTTIAQGVFLANLDATEVRISVTDLTEGVVYQETISLVVPVSQSSFYNWCFKRLRNNPSTVSVALPPYANALITIAIKKPGGTAKCGVCAIGPVVDVGISQQGLGREIKDYSTINFNFDGTSNQVTRGFSKRMDLDVVIDYDQVDTVISALEGYRQKPVAWIASPDYDSACVFGRYSSFKNVMNDWPLAKMSLQIEGTV